MNKFILWCLNVTSIVVVIELVSFHLGFGERAAYGNAVFAILVLHAFAFARGSYARNVWSHVCLTALFVQSAALMLNTFLVALSRPLNAGGSSWELVSETVAAMGFIISGLCATFFSRIIATELCLRRPRIFLGFVVQGTIFYVMLARGHQIARLLFGQ